MTGDWFHVSLPRDDWGTFQSILSRTVGTISVGIMNHASKVGTTTSSSSSSPPSLNSPNFPHTSAPRITSRLRGHWRAVGPWPSRCCAMAMESIHVAIRIRPMSESEAIYGLRKPGMRGKKTESLRLSMSNIWGYESYDTTILWYIMIYIYIYMYSIDK